MATVKCPNCGSYVKLPEKSSVVCGETISKNSEGNYVLEMENSAENMDNNRNDFINTKITTEYGAKKTKPTKEIKKMANEANRMEALKDAGFDVSNFITQLSEMGITVDSNGNLSKKSVDKVVVDDDDPVLEEIYANGYIKNTKTHRRFVAAQMWDALNYKSYKGSGEGYNAWLNDTKDYNYQFRLLIDELNVLTKMHEDPESYNERETFFNTEVAIALCKDYAEKLRERCDNLDRHKCKGMIDYIYIGGKAIFVEDLYKKLYAPIERDIEKIRKCTNDAARCAMLNRFYKNYVSKYKLPRNTKKCNEWIDAYKGSGAYYTLKNFIQYSGLTIKDYEAKGSEVLSGKKAVKHIKSLLGKYKGYQYMAMLKKAIDENNFDLRKVIKQN